MHGLVNSRIAVFHVLTRIYARIQLATHRAFTLIRSLGYDGSGDQNILSKLQLRANPNQRVFSSIWQRESARDERGGK